MPVGWAVLGAAVLAGALLRLHFLGAPMRYDEAWTFDHYAIRHVSDITSTYDVPNNHILYTLLVHFTWRALGNHVWTVRLAALAAGVALIPAVYLVAQRLYGRGAAIWAACLTAGFAPLVDYSVSGRGYTVGALLMLGALWAGARLLDERSRWAWAAFVACCALSVYTVPTMAYGVATVAIWMALVALTRRPVGVRILVELGLALTLAAGIALLLYSAVLGQRGWSFPPSLPVAWRPITHLMSAVWANWNRAAPLGLGLLVAAGFIVSLVVHRHVGRHRVPIAAAALIVLAGVAVSGRISPFPRSWLYLLPFYLLSAGAGLDWLVRRAARTLGSVELASGIAAVCVAAGFGIAMLGAGLRGQESPPASDKHVAEFVRRFIPRGHQAVVDSNIGPALEYYFRARPGELLLVSNVVRGPERRERHTVVIVGHGTSPIKTVRRGGGIARGRPRLLLHREWIDFYDVPISRDKARRAA